MCNRGSLLEIPSFLNDIVRDISNECDVISIWLVGSRANQTAQDNSDWDIVVFQNKPLKASMARHVNVDIIRVYENKFGMVDGKNIEFSFDSWEWSGISDLEAQYKGQKFIDYSNGVRDMSDPIYKKSACRGFCLWSRCT